MAFNDSQVGNHYHLPYSSFEAQKRPLLALGGGSGMLTPLWADLEALSADFGHDSGCRRLGCAPFSPEGLPTEAGPGAASRIFNWSFE